VIIIYHEDKFFFDADDVIDQARHDVLNGWRLRFIKSGTQPFADAAVDGGQGSVNVAPETQQVVIAFAERKLGKGQVAGAGAVHHQRGFPKSRRGRNQRAGNPPLPRLDGFL
jgi:hypothetical protein